MVLIYFFTLNFFQNTTKISLVLWVPFPLKRSMNLFVLSSIVAKLSPLHYIQVQLDLPTKEFVDTTTTSSLDSQDTKIQRYKKGSVIAGQQLFLASEWRKSSWHGQTFLLLCCVVVTASRKNQPWELLAGSGTYIPTVWYSLGSAREQKRGTRLTQRPSLAFLFDQLHLQPIYCKQLLVLSPTPLRCEARTITNANQRRRCKKR